MSDEIEQTLGRIARGLPTVDWQPASVLRRRGTRRRRALLAVVAAGVAVLLVGGGLTAWTLVTPRRPGNGIIDVIGAAGSGPPAPESPCPSVRVDIPERGKVLVNVYNGTNRVGLAGNVGADLGNRGFMVGRVADADPAATTFLRYGPDGVGNAWLVSAYFLEPKMAFDLLRTGSEVDVVLGDSFQQLLTITEVNQRIAAMGKPTPPSGTCASPIR